MPVYQSQDGNVKRHKLRGYYLLKGIIKIYNIFLNGKSFYDQPIDSDIKRYTEIRKLTAGQGKDYITKYLLEYEDIKIIID